jgi:hypothetical protein
VRGEEICEDCKEKKEVLRLHFLQKPSAR